MCVLLLDIFKTYRNFWTLDARVGRWTLDAGLWTLGSGRWILEFGLWTLGTVVNCCRIESEHSF